MRNVRLTGSQCRNASQLVVLPECETVCAYILFTSSFCFGLKARQGQVKGRVHPVRATGSITRHILES